MGKVMQSGFIKAKYFLFLCGFILLISGLTSAQKENDEIKNIIIRLDKDRVVKDADRYLGEDPVTITSFKAERSSGGIHDFYSEGDYWWQNPADPNGPYIRRDGYTNPNNFTAHRDAMRRLSIQVPALTAAYIMTGNRKYAEHAIKHILAWFADEKTMMNPNMLYAQAIKGVAKGRGIGIIDTIHLIEVVQAIMVLEEHGMIAPEDLKKIKDWFRQYSQWLTTHQYGIDERNNGNNHSTCWNMQAAQYAKVIGDNGLLEYCRQHFKEELLPKQMAKDGSFPKELERTKPYGYSLFNLDAMTAAAWILSTPKDNLWEYKTVDGISLKAAVEFMYPYIKDKSLWPYKKDVMYFESWPVRHASLLFGGIAYRDKKYITLWERLEGAPVEDEVIRNFFIRQPILWV